MLVATLDNCPIDTNPGDCIGYRKSPDTGADTGRQSAPLGRLLDEAARPVGQECSGCHAERLLSHQGIPFPLPSAFSSRRLLIKVYPFHVHPAEVA